MRGERSRQVRAAAAAMVETLEGRRLLSLSLMPVYDLAPTASVNAPVTVKSTSGVFPQGANPIVTGSNPANGSVDVPRYSPIRFNIQLADTGGGIDPATLS